MFSRPLMIAFPIAAVALATFWLLDHEPEVTAAAPQAPESAVTLPSPALVSTAPRPDLRLLGTLAGARIEDGQAMLALGADPGALHRLGHEIAGWRLSRIEHDQVTLEKSGETWVLGMNAGPATERPPMRVPMPVSGREPPPGYPGRIVDGTPGVD